MAIGLSVEMICCGPHLQLLAATPCFRAMHVPQGTADAGPFLDSMHLTGFGSGWIQCGPPARRSQPANGSLRPPRQASRNQKLTKPSSRQHTLTGLSRPRATVSGLQPSRCPVPSSQRYEAKGRHWGPANLGNYLPRKAIRDGSNLGLSPNPHRFTTKYKALPSRAQEKTPTNPGTPSRHHIEAAAKRPAYAAYCFPVSHLPKPQFVSADPPRVEVPSPQYFGCSEICTSTPSSSTGAKSAPKVRDAPRAKGSTTYQGRKSPPPPGTCCSQ